MPAGADVVVRARSNLVRSYGWREESKRLGIVGTIKSLEVTVSRPRGGHPHLHELVLVDRPFSNEEFGRWWLGMREPWADAVSRLDPTLRPEDRLIRLGVDVRRVEADEVDDVVAGYMAKDELTGVALEVARPEAKAGRAESMGPFELGERAADGDR